MASNSPSEQQVWTLAHQLLLSTQEGLLCHMEVLITFAGASWHPTRPLPARSAYSPAPGAHAWARWGAPHCCPYKSPLPEKVVKLKDIETVHYQIKNRVPLIWVLGVLFLQLPYRVLFLGFLPSVSLHLLQTQAEERKSNFFHLNVSIIEDHHIFISKSLKLPVNTPLYLSFWNTVFYLVCLVHVGSQMTWPPCS